MIEEQQQPRNKLMQWLPLVLAALPAFIPFWLILHDGVNMPYWDEWDRGFVDLAIKAHHGTLNWSDFTAPHNEHRIVVPKVIYLVLTSATHWNEFALMYFSWAVACVSSICIGVLCFRTSPKPRALVLWFLCNLLIFSPTQWENWLAGYGMINFLPVMFMLVGLAVGGSKLGDWPKIALLILLATAATFSSLQGFLAWPVLGILLAWPGSCFRLGHRFRGLLTWGVAFGANVLLYVIGYHAETSSQSAQTPMSLIDRIRFGLAYLGNPFFINAIDRLNYAVLVGSIMFMLFLAAGIHAIYCWRRQRQVELVDGYLIWLVLGGFALATGLLAVIFRSSIGMQMALAGRYVTATVFLPIALINLLPRLGDDLSLYQMTKLRRIRMPALGTLLSCFLVIYMLSSYWGWKDADKATRDRRKGKGDLLLIDPLPLNPLLASYVNPKPERMIPLAREMNRIGYLHPPLITSSNPLDFEDRNPPANPFGKYGAITELQNLNYNLAAIIGWAILPHRHRPAAAVVLSFQDQNDKPVMFLTAVTGQRIPELKTVLGDSTYEFAGWFLVVPVNQFEGRAKVVRINAWAIDVDTGLAYKLDGQVEIHR